LRIALTVGYSLVLLLGFPAPQYRYFVVLSYAGVDHRPPPA
jgi:hypothetical protein